MLCDGRGALSAVWGRVLGRTAQSELGGPSGRIGENAYDAEFRMHMEILDSAYE
jgi:hypothetical protein